jgi:hypothetical protein
MIIMLGLGNSLVNSSVSSWAPSNESTLVAWYQYQTGITLNGSDVSEWADYTGVIIIWFKKQKLINLLIQVEL